MPLFFGAVVKAPPPPPPPSPAAPSIPLRCPLSSLNFPPVTWGWIFPATPPTVDIAGVLGSHGVGAGTKLVPVSGCFGGGTIRRGYGFWSKRGWRTVFDQRGRWGAGVCLMDDQRGKGRCFSKTILALVCQPSTMVVATFGNRGPR